MYPSGWIQRISPPKSRPRTDANSRHFLPKMPAVHKRLVSLDRLGNVNIRTFSRIIKRSGKKIALRLTTAVDQRRTRKTGQGMRNRGGESIVDIFDCFSIEQELTFFHKCFHNFLYNADSPPVDRCLASLSGIQNASASLTYGTRSTSADRGRNKPLRTKPARTPRPQRAGDDSWPESCRTPS